MENSENEEVVVVQKTYRGWGSIGILFSAFGFIVLMAAFYFGLNYLLIETKKNQVAFASLDKEVNQTKEQVSNLNNNDQLKQLQDQVNTQQQTLNDLRQSQKQSNAQWVLAEANYLVKLANDNLTIGDNIPLVITLLKSADQRLQSLNDDKLNSIRQAIAGDISALQALPQIDTAGIYAQLTALNNQVDNLPLPNNRPIVSAPAENNTLPWYKRGWQQTLTALKQIVVIRYNKNGDHAFIAPDVQPFLYQNLHATFEQAMFAVLRKQPEIYQLSLKQAQEWITKYFLQDSQVTKAMLDNITKLQALPIKNKLPTLDASLTAFQNASMSA